LRLETGVGRNPAVALKRRFDDNSECGGRAGRDLEAARTAGASIALTKAAFN